MSVMRAAQLVAFRQPLAIADLEVPTPPGHGVVVKLQACGVCRTDWHIWRGHWDWLGVHPTFPLVLGHEMAGVVTEVGTAVERFRVGDRVLAPFHYACGSCDRCQSGQQNLCEKPSFPGSSIAGGFAESVVVPHADVNLLHLPDNVTAAQASALGCRFMTAFHGAVELGEVRPGEWLAVFGCGGVGLSAVMIAAAAGANVVAIDIDDAKLELARSIGADFTVNSRDQDAVEAVRAITGGGADVSIDALGIEQTVLGSIRSLRTRGRHVQIGLTTSSERGTVAVPIDLIVARELRIMGCHGMPRPRYASLLAMVSAGKLDPGRLIGREISLDQASEVLAGMDRFETVGFSVITSW